LREEFPRSLLAAHVLRPAPGWIPKRDSVWAHRGASTPYGVVFQPSCCSVCEGSCAAPVADMRSIAIHAVVQISEATVFDGLADDILHHEKYFSLCISMSRHSH
jgi:hypothetical protein